MTRLSVRPATLDLDLYGGDGFAVLFEFKDKTTSQPVPLGGTWKAQIRNGTLLTEFTIDLTEALNGKVRLSLTGEQTNALAEATPCGHGAGSNTCDQCPMWDLEQTDGAVRTWYRGAVRTVGDVTHV